jgi:hypothetical protein
MGVSATGSVIELTKNRKALTAAVFCDQSFVELVNKLENFSESNNLNVRPCST